LSVAGQFGAFNAATATTNQNVGSPGSISSVPEPSALVLAGLGLLGLGWMHARRRRGSAG
jgi:hypothetical protein